MFFSNTLSALPAVPTMIEAGFAGFEASAWFGLLAPADTPPEVIQRLHGELVQGGEGRTHPGAVRSPAAQGCHCSA